MQPNLSFEVLDWADAVHVVKVRIFGTDHTGKERDEVVAFRGLVTIGEVHAIVAKMNNNHYRA